MRRDNTREQAGKIRERTGRKKMRPPPLSAKEEVLATSFHPSSLKRGLPKSQFYRLRRICHSDSDFIESR